MAVLDDWRGRRVYLTGHTGFKGAWLCLLLKRLGASVRGYALAPPTSPNLFDLTGIGDWAGNEVSDIRNIDRLTADLREAAPDLVVHLAAQPLVRRSYRDPQETYSSNVTGTLNVLEAIRATPSVRAAIVVTTDKVYDLSAGTTPRRETDSLGGCDPYSASKAAAELLTASHRDCYFSGAPDTHPALVATVRSGNVIGGGDWSEDRIVTDIVAAMQAERQIVLRYPDAVRPWMYVLDSLIGYLKLADRLLAGDRDYAAAWNFGPVTGSDVSVRQLVETFASVWERDNSWTTLSGTTLPESQQLRLDPGKAMSHLSWQPAFTQDEAIRETAIWFRELQNGDNPVELCNSAIEKHLARLDQIDQHKSAGAA